VVIDIVEYKRAALAADACGLPISVLSKPQPEGARVGKTQYQQQWVRGANPRDHELNRGIVRYRLSESQQLEFSMPVVTRGSHRTMTNGTDYPGVKLVGEYCTVFNDVTSDRISAVGSVLGLEAGHPLKHVKIPSAQGVQLRRGNIKDASLWFLGFSALGLGIAGVSYLQYGWNSDVQLGIILSGSTAGAGAVLTTALLPRYIKLRKPDRDGVQQLLKYVHNELAPEVDAWVQTVKVAEKACGQTPNITSPAALDDLKVSLKGCKEWRQLTAPDNKKMHALGVFSDDEYSGFAQMHKHAGEKIESLEESRTLIVAYQELKKNTEKCLDFSATAEFTVEPWTMKVAIPAKSGEALCHDAVVATENALASWANRPDLSPEFTESVDAIRRKQAELRAAVAKAEKGASKQLAKIRQIRAEYTPPPLYSVPRKKCKVKCMDGDGRVEWYNRESCPSQIRQWKNVTVTLDKVCE
jgi:hypothetical protein